MHRKNVLLIIFLLLSGLLFTYPAHAASDLTIYVDQQAVQFQADPYIANGLTMVPWRELMNELGANLSWDEKTSGCTAVLPGATLTVVSGSPTARLNGRELLLPAAPVINNGSLYVPLRAICQACHIKIDWDSTTGSIYLSRDKSIQTIPELLYLQGKAQAELLKADQSLAESAQKIGTSGLNSSQTRDCLQKLAALYPYIVDCCTVDSRGVMTAVEPSAYSRYEGSDISRQEQVKLLRQTGQPVLSDGFKAVEGFVAVDIEQVLSNSQDKMTGSVSMLIKPEAFFDYIIPALSRAKSEVMVIQKDGYILYDTDKAQIGRNTFTDSIYQNYPGVLSLCRKVVAAPAGNGSYDFLNENGQTVTKEAFWTTIGLHGTEWRLVISRPADDRVPANVVADREALCQLSTLNALMAGYYDGLMTFRDLAAYGDTGLGTFAGLDGEMIAVDGRFYQIKADGAAYPVDDSLQSPFACVTHFDNDKSLTINERLDFSQLQKCLDDMIGNKNLFYMFKVQGDFSCVKTRSVPGQNKPYPPLVEVTKNQAVFELNNVSGTIVALWCPDYVKGINLPGYHMHFLSSDAQAGGHLLDCRVENARVQMDITPAFYINLPASADFGLLDLAADQSQNAQKAEK